MDVMSIWCRATGFKLGLRRFTIFVEDFDDGCAISALPFGLLVFVNARDEKCSHHDGNDSQADECDFHVNQYGTKGSQALLTIDAPGRQPGSGRFDSVGNLPPLQFAKFRSLAPCMEARNRFRPKRVGFKPTVQMKPKTSKLTAAQKAQVLGDLPFGYYRKGRGIVLNPQEFTVLLNVRAQRKAAKRPAN